MSAVEHATPPVATARPAPMAQVFRVAARLAGRMVRAWRERSAMRRLAELSDWQLADIGLTREDLLGAGGGTMENESTRMLQDTARRRHVLREDAARRIS